MTILPEFTLLEKKNSMSEILYLDHSINITCAVIRIRKYMLARQQRNVTRNDTDRFDLDSRRCTSAHPFIV